MASESYFNSMLKGNISLTIFRFPAPGSGLVFVHFFGLLSLVLSVPWAPLESRECCVVPERLAWRVDVCACGWVCVRKEV